MWALTIPGRIAASRARWTRSASRNSPLHEPEKACRGRSFLWWRRSLGDLAALLLRPMAAPQKGADLGHGTVRHLQMLNERGLTLVEVLVAAAIIGIGLVGLMTVVPVSSFGVRE